MIKTKGVKKWQLVQHGKLYLMDVYYQKSTFRMMSPRHNYTNWKKAIAPVTVVSYHTIMKQVKSGIKL